MGVKNYNRKGLWARAFAVFVLVLLFLHCGVSTGFCAEKAYKIGAVFSVTGVASFLGEPEKKTAEMVVDQVNASGGINGHKVELILYDDESDATKATLAVKRLIKKDGVAVIIGPTRSGESLAVAPIAEKEQIPLVSCAASYKIVTPIEERRWVFKTAPSDSHAVERIYEHMKSKGYKRIAILSESTGFGASGREELLRYAGQYGLEIVADERYGPKDTDLTAQFTKVRSLNPDAIVNWSVGPTQVLAVKTWRDLGMTSIPLYQSHGFGSKKNLELLGEAANGVLFPISAVVVGDLLPDSHPQKAVIMEYWKAYRQRYNEPVSSFGGHAWDAIQLVISALKAVGPNPSKIRDYLENLTGFVGQSGVFNFSPQDHNGLSKKDLVMVVVRNQNWALAE